MLDEYVPSVPEDPFRADRVARGVRFEELHGERFLMLLRWRDVRQAARDFQTFDSSVRGRVPTPPEDAIRPYRQLPIETNPPEHTAWKDLVQVFFRRPTQPGPKAEIEALVEEAVETALVSGSIEVVEDFSLPLQSRALCVLLDTDPAIADDWIGWGLHAFRTNGQTDPAKAKRFLDFIDGMLTRGRTEANLGLFSALHSARIEGRLLSDNEKRGICHLALAGGRDTVINAMTGTLAYFATYPDDLGRLRENPDMIPTATEELFRVLSPLPQIARVCPHGAEREGLEIEPDARASLCWASANRDETIFDAPNEVRLDRSPNPHVAFGAGHHTCLGAPHARLLIRSLLATLAEKNVRLDIQSAEPRTTQFGTPYLFDALHLRMRRGSKNNQGRG